MGCCVGDDLHERYSRNPLGDGMGRFQGETDPRHLRYLTGGKGMNGFDEQVLRHVRVLAAGWEQDECI